MIYPKYFPPRDAIRVSGVPYEVEMQQTETKPALAAQKFDGDKPRMDLLDRYAIEQLASVLTFGARKYAAHNWRNGLEYSRLVAAALRHIHAFNDGEDLDPESGLPHAAHAMCCLMFLLGTMKHRPDMDDRWRVGMETKGNHGG